MNEFTYGQMEEALLDLGFRRVANDDYFVMRNDEHDAILALAKGDNDSIVRPAYRLAVNSAVVWRGVATEADLEKALNKARRNRAEQGASPSLRIATARTKSKAKAPTPA